MKKNVERKWYILGLVVLTNMFIVAIPTMGLSVLSKQISTDLHLNLVQMGIVWGVGGLPGIFTGLLGGAIGDKLGPKRIIMVATLLAGLAGLSRGLASNFAWMVISVLISGGLIPFVTMNGFKICGQWFPSKQLGLANGVISMGMAFGFLLGALLSATLFVPLLGGWRNVLMVYGMIGALLCIPWFFVEEITMLPGKGDGNISIRRSIFAVSRLKNVWLLGMTLFGVGGCVQGLLGYLPIYLRGAGWDPIFADGVLSAFHTASMIFVIPVALWSDRLSSRKTLLFASGLLIATGTGLLAFVNGSVVWVAVVMAGFVRDAFMAIFLTMVIETEGVGPVYAGTATGFVMALVGFANFISPPLGNSFARFFPSAPFLVWSLFAVGGLMFLSLVKMNPAKQKILEEEW
jgi:MFS family permease